MTNQMEVIMVFLARFLIVINNSLASKESLFSVTSWCEYSSGSCGCSCSLLWRRYIHICNFVYEVASGCVLFCPAYYHINFEYLLNIKGGNKPINSRFYPSWKIRMEQFCRSYHIQLSFEAAPDGAETFSLFSPEVFLRLLRLRFFFEFLSPTAASWTFTVKSFFKVLFISNN